MQHTDVGGPAANLHTASILVRSNSDGWSKTLRRTTWASAEEAQHYINRRLPQQELPDEYAEQPDAYVFGEVRPSQTQIVIMHGEAVQILAQSRTTIDRAVIRDGRACWNSVDVLSAKPPLQLAA